MVPVSYSYYGNHETFAKSAKDSKARRDIDKAIGRAVEGAFSNVQTVNITTKTAPNATLTVYNKTSSGSILPKPIIPPQPQICNKDDHLEAGVCVPDNPAAGFKVCMVGDFKDKRPFDAMAANGCNYNIALGDNGYGNDLSLLKEIAPDKCVIGNHDAKEDESADIEKEALAYCGDSWWVKFGSSTLMLGFNTNGDLAKQATAAKKVIAQFPDVKNVILVSHKGGHTFPNSHHPAEAKALFTEIEKVVPPEKLIQVAGHNHNIAAAPDKGLVCQRQCGRSFYSCGQDQNWTFCNNKTIAYLQATIQDSGDITVHFIDQTGKIIF